MGILVVLVVVVDEANVYRAFMAQPGGTQQAGQSINLCHKRGPPGMVVIFMVSLHLADIVGERHSLMRVIGRDSSQRISMELVAFFIEAHKKIGDPGHLGPGYRGSSRCMSPL